MWELKPWVDASKLHLIELHYNPNSFDYLLLYQFDYIKWNLLCLMGSDDALITISDKSIDWKYLSMNPTITALHRLKQHKQKIIWFDLLSNPYAIELIIENFNKIKKIKWITMLSQNPHPKAIELLSKNINKIDWYYLSANPSAMQLLLQYPEKINWRGLSLNPSATDLLLKNTDKIDWFNFNKNPHPTTIAYLKEHQEHIIWSTLCTNPSAEELLILYPEKILWHCLSSNPCIFEYNYKKCRTVFRTTLLKEEIIAMAMHPDRIDYYLKLGYTLSDF
jgi:hypothetical protein